MSPTRTRYRDFAVNALITTIATLFLTFGTGVWASKESTTSHAADMQRVNGKLERILDVLCQRETTARACNETADTPSK